MPLEHFGLVHLIRFRPVLSKMFKCPIEWYCFCSVSWKPIVFAIACQYLSLLLFSFSFSLLLLTLLGTCIAWNFSLLFDLAGSSSSLGPFDLVQC